MPKKAKKGDAKFAKAMATLAGIAKEHGLPLDFDGIKETRLAGSRNPHEKHAREHVIDGVLLSLHKSHAVKIKKCRYCEEAFGTSYCYVGYCSTSCRVKDLATVGIVLNPDTPTWQDTTWHQDLEPPVTITPALVQKMEIWAKQFLDQLELVRQLSLANIAVQQDSFGHPQAEESQCLNLVIADVALLLEEHEIPASSLEEPIMLMVEEFSFE